MTRPSVLHLSTTDNDGGSGRSAQKIHRGLCELGYDSKMLVRRKVTSDDRIGLISDGWLKLVDRACSKVTDATGLQNYYLPSSIRLFDHPWYRAADIIQLYNTHGKFLSHSILPRMSQEKQVAWRLSDMWPMTGHCGYAGECDKWLDGCQTCPDLKAYPSIKWDTAGHLWRHKQRLYEKSRIQIVAPSTWISDLSKASPLLGRFPRQIIRNGVDLDVFRKMDRQHCRHQLRISLPGKALLFVSAVIRDARKGFAEFFELVCRLWEERQDFFVMLVGAGVTDWEVDLPCPIWKHDRITKDDQLARVYNAANLTVHPAKVENLPNSLIESMACGTPAVAFDTGGVGELVQHKKNGYLATPGDAAALLAGARWMWEDESRLRLLSAAGQSLVRQVYSLQKQSNSFARLYEQLFDNGTSRAAA